MPRFDGGEVESTGAQGRLRCGGCGKGMDLLPGGQELGHADGTELCTSSEVDLDPVEISNRINRMKRLEARHLLAVEPWDERDRGPRGWAVAVLFLLIGAMLVGCLLGVASEWPR